jgi:hypothetical protein
VIRSVCAFAAPACGCVSVEEVFEPGEHFLAGTNDCVTEEGEG